MRERTALLLDGGAVREPDEEPSEPDPTAARDTTDDDRGSQDALKASSNGLTDLMTA